MNNGQELWNQVKELLKGCTEKSAYDAEFEPITEVFKFQNNTITLILENGFKRWKIEKYYLATMNKLLVQTTCDENLKFDFISKEDAEKERSKEVQEPTKVESTLFKSRILRQEYTFDNFVTGEANREAFTFSIKIAESPSVTINPFYIFGDVGLGKTHLMTAIGHYILENKPNANIIYTTAQQFVEDFFKAKNKNQKQTSLSDEFDNYYRSADVLLVDDVQYFADKQGSQDEFFKLFEYLFNLNKQIVITSDRPANELNLMGRLKSRFSWGIQTDLKKPNSQLREAIIKKKLKFLIDDPSVIPDDVITYIADNFDENVRELEGAIRRLINYCVAFNIDYSLENAKIALEPILSKEKASQDGTSNTNVEKIKEIIANYFNINVKELSSTSRKQEYVYARNVTIYILKTKYNYTLNKMGNVLGNRDHATISHSFEKIQDQIKSDSNIKEDIDNVIEILNKQYK